MSFALRRGGWLLGVELTGHCDLRCKHCLRDDLSTVVELEPSFLGDLLDQALALGPPHVAFTGGEVTLHSRFFELLRAVAERDLTFHFVTNGKSYPRIRAELLGFRGAMTGFTVSLDGASRAVHDRVRGRGAWDAAVMAIALAARDEWQVTVQMAIHAANRHELRAMAELCRDLGASLLVYAHTQPTERASRNGLDLSPEAWLAIDREVEAIGRAIDLPVMVSAGHYDPNPLAHCQTLRHQSFNVDCHGRLTFCCQLSGVAGEPREADVVADLREVSLLDAMDAHVELGQRVIRERLRYLAASPDDPYRDFHCHFCLKRFGKLAHLQDAGAAASPRDARRLHVFR
jgi:sulfatase maturation enzyme AslB (radical SAM superfamily)